jgi:hypothetical protein
MLMDALLVASANSGKGWRQGTTMPLSQNCPTVRSSLGVILIKYIAVFPHVSEKEIAGLPIFPFFSTLNNLALAHQLVRIYMN